MSRRVKEPNYPNALEMKHDAFGKYTDVNGQRFYHITTALVDGVTAVGVAPQGSFARTSNATGRDKIFVAGAATWAAFGEIADRPFLTYNALLTQAGTAAPSASVRENQLSGAIVWARTGAGVYTGTLAGAFLADKVTALATLGEDATALSVKVGRTSDNVITVRTFDDAGVAADLVGTLNLAVLVYP